MQPFPQLPELQRLLSYLIRAPEGVVSGTAALVASGDLESPDLSFAIEPNDRMTASERLDVYASMYFYRLHDCLAEDFPRVRTQIGSENFHNLVTNYLIAHPPSHHSLREAGRALPEFVSSHALKDVFPALADLARLEWARIDVFDDEDAPPLDRETLLERSAADPNGFSIHLIPAARVLRLPGRALALWQDAAQQDAPLDSDGLRCTLVWRKGFAVFHRRAAKDEERCLDALASGDISLPELADLLSNPDTSSEQTSERFAGLLDLWLQDELVCALPLPGES